MEKQIDLLILNSSKLVTLGGQSGPKVGNSMKELSIIEHGAVAVNNGIIVETGTTKELSKKYGNAKEILDAENHLVMPGFVDCHTHLVFGGTREYEFALKVAGATYINILKSGGGINASVSATRSASEKDLFNSGKEKLDAMMRHGTTTVEAKTGYGLEYNAEKKVLHVINELNKEHPMDIISTFLGAHIVPTDTQRDDYIAMLKEKALPDFKDLAEYCDVFTEIGAYTVEETKDILNKAKELGYKLKVHAGQFTDMGAAGMASEMGAISIDHLEFVSVEQLNIMKKNKTACVLMPGVPFFLMNGKYPDARKMINNGNIVSLATDFNPGSCPAYSMQMIIALACYQMKMSPEEAISASTINAAYAIDRSHLIGSLETGKKADIIILNVQEVAHIPYFFGSNLVQSVIKSGAWI